MILHGLLVAISSIRKEWSYTTWSSLSPEPQGVEFGRAYELPPPSPASTRTGVTRTVLRRFQHPQGLEFDKANGLFVAISSIRKDWSFTDCPSPSPTSARIGVRQSARIVRRHLEHPQAVEFLTDCPSLSPASARIGVRQSAWAVGRHLQHPQGLEVHGLPFAISSIRKDWSSPKRTGCWSPSSASARTGGTRSVLRNLQHPQGLVFGKAHGLLVAISSIRKEWSFKQTVPRHLQHPQGLVFGKRTGCSSFAIANIRKEWRSTKRTDCSSASPASARSGVPRTVLRNLQHPQGLVYGKAHGLLVAILSTSTALLNTCHVTS